MKVRPRALEKQYKTRVFVGDKEYRVGASSEPIPFEGNSLTITVKTVLPGSSTTAETVGKTYTFTILRDQHILTQEGDVTVDLLRKDGTVMQEGVVPSFTVWSGDFATSVSAYTADESKNTTGFVLHLPNLPEGVTGQVITSGGTCYAIENGTATVQGELARYGTIYFTIRLNANGGRSEYELRFAKPAATLGLSKCGFAGGNQAYNAENIYNGQPEGTMFQVNSTGKETGETGFDANWYEYNIHVTEKIQNLKSNGYAGIKLLSSSMVQVTVNGKVLLAPAKAIAGTALASQLMNVKNRIQLSGEKTDLCIRIENAKDSTDVVTYTFHIIRHSIEAAELEAMIQALPEVKYFVYSEHEAAVRQAKKIYDECKDEVKAQLSDGAKAKIEAL